MNKDQKNQLRKRLTLIRDAINEQRRRSAACHLYDKITDWCGSIEKVLSYASFRSELDTADLNFYLADQERLVLPRLSRDQKTPWEASLYLVRNPFKDLISNPLGIQEPNPDTCPLVAIEEIGLALVPGLGFDMQRQRIGYGKGTYDRLLAGTAGLETVGVGYREQLLATPIPVESHDVSLSSLLLL